MKSESFNCEQIQAGASEFIDDELTPSAQLVFEQHLAGCDECRALVTDLAAIRSDAGALDVLVPSRDLWGGIDARIQPSVLPFVAAPPHSTPSSRRYHFPSRLVLGGIAAALIGAVALGRWSVSPSTIEHTAVVEPSNARVARTTPPPADSLPATSAPAPAAPETVQGGAATTPVASVNRPTARVTYQREIEALQSVMDESGDFLDPTTKAVIEASLRTVDSAIAEARAALARDPRSTFLAEQLNRSLGRKLGLLRTAALHSTSL